MSTDGTITAWGNHVDGAVTLTKLRGTDQFNNPMSLAMFRAVRTMMITSCVQRSKPVDTFPGTQGWMGTGDMSEENAANRLTLICIDLPNLRARANRLTSSPYSTTEAPEARQILEFAQLVDDNLDAWYRTLPPEWKHRIIGVEGGAISDEDLAEAEKWPGEQHVYHDIPLASIMNDYRVCRIFCRRVMLACVEWLGDGGVGVYEQSVFVVQQMVDEISACVPFHMCYDLQPVARESGQEQYGMLSVCLHGSPRSLFFSNLNNPIGRPANIDIQPQKPSAGTRSYGRSTSPQTPKPSPSASATGCSGDCQSSGRSSGSAARRCWCWRGDTCSRAGPCFLDVCRLLDRSECHLYLSIVFFFKCLLSLGYGVLQVYDGG
jgi:hypothetical protein